MIFAVIRSVFCVMGISEFDVLAVHTLDIILYSDKCLENIESVSGGEYDVDKATSFFFCNHTEL